jgi:hypothetical protein
VACRLHSANVVDVSHHQELGALFIICKRASMSVARLHALCHRATFAVTARLWKQLHGKTTSRGSRKQP